jgi:biopolymer transport protein ExbD
MFNDLCPLRRQKNADDNLIPLINIVFLLLIFFMIAGKIEQIHDAGISLPTASETKPAMAVPITLQLSLNHDIRLNNQLLPQEQLAGKLAQLLTEHPANIAVRADKQLAYRDVDRILTILRGAGFTSIKLFTLTASEAK